MQWSARRTVVSPHGDAMLGRACCHALWRSTISNSIPSHSGRGRLPPSTKSAPASAARGAFDPFPRPTPRGSAAGSSSSARRSRSRSRRRSRSQKRSRSLQVKKEVKREKRTPSPRRAAPAWTKLRELQTKQRDACMPRPPQPAGPPPASLGPRVVKPEEAHGVNGGGGAGGGEGVEVRQVVLRLWILIEMAVTIPP